SGAAGFLLPHLRTAGRGCDLAELPGGRGGQRGAGLVVLPPHAVAREGDRRNSGRGPRTGECRWGTCRSRQSLALRDRAADWRLLALRPPALNDALNQIFFPAGLTPQIDEAGIFGSGSFGFVEIVEGDAYRDRNTLAADDALTVAERGDGIEEPTRAF